MVKPATPLLCDVRDSIAWLTLNRPERLNAVNAELYSELSGILPRLHESAEVRAIVITGAGRAFCAGGDVKAMGSRTPRHHLTGDERVRDRVEERQRLEAVHATVLQIARLPKPVIAGINGAVAGAGLSLALGCDFRLAGAGAVVTTAFADVGLPGDSGISQLLVDAVGLHRARHLLMRPHRMNAAEAAALGLVDEVAASEDFVTALQSVAEEFAAGSPAVYAAIKQRLLRRDMLAVALDQELEATLDCQETDYHIDAIQRMRAGRARVAPTT